jgi:glycosyltransferase involved in cell wall biosynthesis
VFESYAWRNYCYGRYDLDGAFYDEVIPNYFEIEDFPYNDKESYYLFVGRINANKGLNIAQEVCQRLRLRLVVAGPGKFSGYGEYVGVIDPKQRSELMSRATALFAPTIYVPPFEGVHVEAQIAGTPVITTDFGVFPESVINGLNGYRCRTLAEFMEAAKRVRYLDNLTIRKLAINKYSLEAVGKQYEDYFKRLSTLYDKGWYT